MVAAVAVPATAATVTVTTQTKSIFGDEQWHVAAKYKKPDVQGNFNVRAGAFQLHTDDWGGLPISNDFMAFCLTPFTYINLKGYPTYTVGTALSGKVQSLLGALAHGAWDKITDATTAGAFQLAAWEIVVDGDAGPLDFGAGHFLLRTGTDVAARTQAQTWLQSIGTGAFKKGTAGLTFLSVAPVDGVDKTQNLVTYTPPSPVPLPGAFGFLIAALAATTALGRMRRV
jgi:hypothetical protein